MQVIIIDSWENVNRGVLMFVVRVFYLWNIYLITQFKFTVFYKYKCLGFPNVCMDGTFFFFFHRGKLQTLTNHSYMLQK